MLTIEINSDEVYRKLNGDIQKLLDVEKVLRSQALNSVAIISERVQEDGLKTDGTPIKTKAKKKYNAYSYSHGKRRSKAGRPTDQIDLTFSGDMMDDFTAELTGKSEYSVGFRSKSAADKAEWNENYFGPIFEHSESELNLIEKDINDQIGEILR